MPVGTDAFEPARKRRAKGEGSVVLLPDGRWQARVTIKGKRTVAYGPTRADAMEALRKKREEAPVPPGGQDPLRKWLAPFAVAIALLSALLTFFRR